MEFRRRPEEKPRWKSFLLCDFFISVALYFSWCCLLNRLNIEHIGYRNKFGLHYNFLLDLVYLIRYRIDNVLLLVDYWKLLSFKTVFWECLFFRKSSKLWLWVSCLTLIRTVIIILGMVIERYRLRLNHMYSPVLSRHTMLLLFQLLNLSLKA